MSKPRRIAFARIAGAALRCADTLARRWLPDGRCDGTEWVALNPTRADNRKGSFKVNLRTGRWSDFATGDSGGDLIALAAYLFHIDRLRQRARSPRRSESIPMNDDPFAPVRGADARGAPPTRSRNGFQCRRCPPDAPPPPSEHPTLGKLSATWRYRDADRRGAGLRAAIRRCRRDKQFRPLTFWRSAAGGKAEWRWESWPPKRPLYGLQRLAERPSSAGRGL